MHQSNYLPPDRMTPEQRRREIASLLAHGLARMRNADAQPSAKNGPESEFHLAFSGNQRVHSDTVNTTHTES